MLRPSLEVADIFAQYGAVWRQSQVGHLSYQQYQVMNAVERCRSAKLGGHKRACPDCGYTQIAYNSCRNRHCPKCQANAAKRWLQSRMQDVLPVEYYHLVFTLPAPLSELAYQNKAVLYKALFQAVSKTLTIIGADSKHLGAKIGGTLVLHTWGSNLSHHPHIHGIITGGGLSPDGQHWIACKKGFFLPVRVLSRLFRRLFLELLQQAFDKKQLQFFNQLQQLSDVKQFKPWINQFRQIDWFVYAKRPFDGPKAVLAYLSRYTHRVAISNSRLLSLNDELVSFKFKDYRQTGKKRYQTMTLDVKEFMRRFLLHVLPRGFHRIRYFGFLSNARRKQNLLVARESLSHLGEKQQQETEQLSTSEIDNRENIETLHNFDLCPVCGTEMIVIEKIEYVPPKRAPPVIPG